MPVYECAAAAASADAACPIIGQGVPAVSRFLRLALPQVCNLIVVHGIVCGMNFRSRRSGPRAARQEEILLASMVALAVTNIVLGLQRENASDYAYATFLIICCASYIKLRWWLSMMALMAPTIAALVRVLHSSHAFSQTATQSLHALHCGASVGLSCMHVASAHQLGALAVAGSVHNAVLLVACSHAKV